MNNMWLYTPRDFFAHARGESEILSFTNTDIYKFVMLDYILAQVQYKDLNVKRQMKIRTKDVRTKDVIPLEALQEQLDMCKDMKWLTDVELAHLRGMVNEKNNWLPLFHKETLEFLKTFQLPDYTIGVDWDNYTLEFEGKRCESTMWEIIALKIINSLYMYYYIKKARLSNVEFTQFISRALVRLFDDINIIKSTPWLTFSEFGTRRSMSTDYQRLVCKILQEQLPDQYLGTSNVMLSREMWQSNPKGTNAHELRMIPTALYDDPQKIIDTLYEIDETWMKHHPWLWVLLPDTFGTSAYYNDCPINITHNHDGNRFDSKDPMIAIPEYNEFLRKYGRDPKDVLWIPSDGLNAQKAKEIYEAFKDTNNLTFGIWTSWTNNTKWLWPRPQEEFGPFGSFSVVVKPMSIQRSDGTRVSTVKLSDNPNKAMWDLDRVALFTSIFGQEWMEKQDILV